MSDNANEGFFKSASPTFGAFDPAKDDYLHPQLNHPHYTATETQYFGFYVPEGNLYGFTYLWLHPNMKSVMGGIFVCQGIKQHHLQAEMYDFLLNMHQDEVLKNDLRSFTLPNSYGVDVLEPGKKMRLRYEEAARGNKVDLMITDVMPVAMRANNKHFEQAMRYEGDITLRGKKYKVDCRNVRDRSWGEPRPEITMSLPPLTWTTGTFNDGFAFNCSAFDHPDLNPLSQKEFPMTAERAFNDGWVWRDGKMAKLKSAKKITTRDPVTGMPMSHRMEMTDTLGREFLITGVTKAGLPMSFWPNCVSFMCMTEWKCEGMTGWGDTQEIQWTDYIRKFRKS